MTRRKLHRLASAAVFGSLLVGFAIPAIRYGAMAVFVAAALLTIATNRPADRR